MPPTGVRAMAEAKRERERESARYQGHEQAIVLPELRADLVRLDAARGHEE
jgi:hypothetical protein